MKTILVGVDFSKSAGNAVDYAAMIAEQTQSKVLLFHAVATPVVHTNSGLYFTAVDYLDKETKERLKEFKVKVSKLYPKVSFEVMLSYIGLRAEVDELIKKKKMHLLVLGHETKSKVERFIYGSTNVDIVGKVDCPVITVPGNFKKRKLRKLVVAVDNNGTIDHGLSRRIHETVNFLGAEAKYVHIKSDDELLVEQNPNKYFKLDVFKSKSFISGIRKFAAKEKADAIMVLSRHHNVFHSLFMDSHSKQLIEKSEIPVVSVHH